MIENSGNQDILKNFLVCREESLSASGIPAAAPIKKITFKKWIGSNRLNASAVIIYFVL